MPSSFLKKGHIHGALACFVPPRTLLASGAAAMAFSAAASFSFSAPAPLLTLLFVFASASSLPRAWAPALASAPPFPETCYNTAIVVQSEHILKLHECVIQTYEANTFETYFLFWSSCPFA